MGYQPSVRDIILAFFRRKTLFMLVCGAVCLAGGAYLLLKQPLYLSGASLVLHFESQTVPNIDRSSNPTQLQGSNEHREILYSDADILRSPDLASRVVESIGRDKMYPQIAAVPGPDTRKQELAVKSFVDNLVIDVGCRAMCSM